MKLQYIILLLVCFLSSIKQGNSAIDSLKLQEELVKNYSILGKNPDSLRMVSTLRLTELGKNNIYLKGQNLRIIATCYFIIYENDSALKYIEKSFTKLEQDYKETAIKALSLMATIQSKLGMIEIAETSFEKALQIAYEVKDEAIICYLQKEIARHLFKTEKFEEAAEMAENCLDYYKSETDNKANDKFDILNILATCKLQTDSFNAKPYLDEAYEAAIELGTNDAISIANVNLASYYQVIGEYEISLEKNLKSIEQIQLSSYPINVIPIYINIGFNYFSLNNLELAETYLKKGIDLAEKNNLTSYLKTGYKHLYKVYNLENRNEEAKDVKIKFLKTALNLEKADSEEQISKLVYLNKVELEKAKNELLELTIQQNENKIKWQGIYLAIISCISIAFIILAIKLFLFSKKLKIKQLELAKINEKIKEISQRKDQLLSILSHDLKEPLTQLIYMQEEILENRIESNNYRHYMTKIHTNSLNAMELLNNFIVWGKTYLSSKLSFTSIELGSIIDCIVHEFESQRLKKGIFIELKIDDLTFNSEKNVIRSVLRNVLSNAIKFSKPSTSIIIESKIIGNSVVVYIKDTGNGFNPQTKTQFEDENQNILNSSVGTTKEKGNGLGLILSRDFAKKIGAELYIEKTDETGTIMALRIPLNQAAD